MGPPQFDWWQAVHKCPLCSHWGVSIPSMDVKGIEDIQDLLEGAWLHRNLAERKPHTRSLKREVTQVHVE